MANPHPSYRFPPGNNANPNGRPKGKTITGQLRDMLNATKLEGVAIGEGKTVRDQLCEVIWKEALKGDIQFIKLAVDRVEFGDLDELRNRLEQLQAARGRVVGDAGDAGGPKPSANGKGPGS